VKGAVLFLVLSALFPYRRRDGEITSWMAILYAPSRFAIEALRHDELPVFAGMTIAQVISVLVFCGGLAGMMMLRRRPVQYR
jgi:phosphatidylglycerol:prolipoprotein diacylglycerol transferase